MAHLKMAEMNHNHMCLPRVAGSARNRASQPEISEVLSNNYMTADCSRCHSNVTTDHMYLTLNAPQLEQKHVSAEYSNSRRSSIITNSSNVREEKQEIKFNRSKPLMLGIQMKSFSDQRLKQKGSSPQ